MRTRSAQIVGVGGLVVLGLLGCNKFSKNKLPKDTSLVLANVAEDKITQNQFQEAVKALVGDEKKADDILKNDAMKEQRNQILEGLAMQKATTRMALSQGLDKDPKVKLMLEQRTAQVYLQAIMEKRIAKLEPTEAQLKTLYDEIVAQRKKEGQDKNLPTFEQAKPSMPTLWKQKQEQATGEALFKEIKQNYPVIFAQGYKPTPQPGQP